MTRAELRALILTDLARAGVATARLTETVLNDALDRAYRIVCRYGYALRATVSCAVVDGVVAIPQGTVSLVSAWRTGSVPLAQTISRSMLYINPSWRESVGTPETLVVDNASGWYVYPKPASADSINADVYLIPTDGGTLCADGVTRFATFTSDSDEPAFRETWHDALAWESERLLCRGLLADDPQAAERYKAAEESLQPVLTAMIASNGSGGG